MQDQLQEMAKKQIRLERLVDTMLQQRQAEKERELQQQLEKQHNAEIHRNASLPQQQQQQNGKASEVRTGRSNAARDFKPATTLSLDLEKVRAAGSRFVLPSYSGHQLHLMRCCRCRILGAPIPSRGKA